MGGQLCVFGSCALSMRRAHPRVCGADIFVKALVGALTGSSPRVRGRPYLPGVTGPDTGLIPACAGQTPFPNVGQARHRAHPRVCGADLPLAHLLSGVNGSSPRVRGRPCPHRRSPPQRGLIPACAGQTSPRRGTHRLGRAHPRVCGADAARCASWPRYSGSSPRVRGRRRTQGSCRGSSTAHPRVCGADHHQQPRGGCNQGSSPRVRGRLCSGVRCSSLSGLIPACAGQTWRTGVGRWRLGAHPRVCGADRSHAAAQA